MSARRLSEATPALALGDLGTVNRWREKVVSVDGWKLVMDGRGHNRFYLRPGTVIVAHWFAFGLVHGAQVLD